MNLFTEQKQTHRHRKQTWSPKGIAGVGWRHKLGVWDEHIHSTTYKMGKQQGPTVQNRDLYSISYNNL